MPRPRSRFRLPAPPVEGLEHHESHVAAAARAAGKGRFDGAPVAHVHQGAPGSRELQGKAGADDAHVAGAEIVDALDPAGLQACVDAQDVAHREGVGGVGDQTAVEVEARAVEAAHASRAEVAQLEAREAVEAAPGETRESEIRLPELPQVQRLPDVEAETRVVPVAVAERVPGQSPGLPGAAAGVLPPRPEGVPLAVELAAQEKPGVDRRHWDDK